MSRGKNNKELLLAWEALLQTLGVPLAWSISTGELYSASDLSLDFEQKGDIQIPDSLTPREREVLEWLLEGKSSRETATILGVSFRTVEKHLQHIYSKVGAHGRAGLFK